MSNFGKPRNAGIHPWQETAAKEQENKEKIDKRKNQYIEELQKPLTDFFGRTINCDAIDFNNDEWLRELIRSNTELEEIYQRIKITIATAVSQEYFGKNIDRNLLEQEFRRTLNALESEEYLNKLTDAIERMVGDYTDIKDIDNISNEVQAQGAYDYLNKKREQIAHKINLNNQFKNN